jgi:hypothetical protein
LVGNSHAAQWLPALQVLAGQEGWALDTYVATRCANATGSLRQIFSGQPDHSAECEQWGQNSTTAIIKGHYDLVVMSNRVSGPAKGLDSIAASQSAYAQGYLNVLKQFRDAGLTVVGIRDTPAPGNPAIPTCLGEHPNDYSQCDRLRASVFPEDPIVSAIGRLHDPKVTLVNLNQYICPPRMHKCPAVIGKMIVYFDNSHLTGLFASSLAPYLKRQLPKI